MRIQLSTVLSIVEIRLSDLVSGRYGDTSKSVNGIDTHLLVHLTVCNDRAENRNQLGRPQVAHRLQYDLFLRVVGALFKQRLQLLPPHINIPLGWSPRFPNVCNRRYLSNTRRPCSQYKSTSNMAASYDNDVTAPRVYTFIFPAGASIVCYSFLQFYTIQVHYCCLIYYSKS